MDDEDCKDLSDDERLERASSFFREQWAASSDAASSCPGEECERRTTQEARTKEREQQTREKARRTEERVAAETAAKAHRIWRESVREATSLSDATKQQHAARRWINGYKDT